jgi:hypothetical protein
MWSEILYRRDCWDRSLKEMMYKEFTVQGKYKWLDLLPRVINFYNNRVHRTTGMKPSDVQKKDEIYSLENIYLHEKREILFTKV